MTGSFYRKKKSIDSDRLRYSWRNLPIIRIFFKTKVSTAENRKSTAYCRASANTETLSDFLNVSYEFN